MALGHATVICDEAAQRGPEVRHRHPAPLLVRTPRLACMRSMLMAGHTCAAVSPSLPVLWAPMRGHACRSAACHDLDRQSHIMWCSWWSVRMKRLPPSAPRKTRRARARRWPGQVVRQLPPRLSSRMRVRLASRGRGCGGAAAARVRQRALSRCPARSGDWLIFLLSSRRLPARTGCCTQSAEGIC